MRKKFFCLEIFIFVWLIIFSPLTSAEGVWRLDGLNKNELPRNFRLIENLNASASGQPSLNGLKKVYEEVRKHTGSTIYIVDLREESHGLADGVPVSWYVEKNRGNFYRGFDEGYEAEQLNELPGKLTEFVPLGNADKKSFKAIKFAPKKISTERKAVENLDSELLKDYASGKYFSQIRYVRFPATDMVFPSPYVVDDFLDFVEKLPPTAWLHFHCHAGHGRTTTFLVFYEILKNPDASLEEICHRQFLLGGSDLLTHSDGGDWYAQAHNDRAEKIKLFYKYMQLLRKGETVLSFSQFWQKEM